MKQPRLKKQYPEDFRSLSGFFMTMFAPAFGTLFLNILLMFFTDYSGIDSAMGKAGYAAAFGTIFLTVTRVIDAIDDPLQGWIVDSAKEIKFGKYRRFGIIGTLILSCGAVMLVCMPGTVKGNPWLLWAWAVFGYLLLDMGGAMGSITGLIMQKSTTVPRVRAKITAVVRMASVIGAVPILFFSTIVSILGKDGNVGAAATKTAVVLCISYAVITLLGIVLLKEPYLEKEKDKRKGGVSVKDILTLLKTDKPLWAHSIGFWIGNMSYGLSSGVMLYFIKWYFCADLGTGEVDLVQFAALSGVYSLMTLLPNFLCPFLTTTVLKIFKTVNRSMYGCMLCMTAGYGVIYLASVTGILKAVPMLLFVLYAIIMLPSGMTAIFSILLTSECADYAEYSVGRSMTALVGSVYGLTQKAASAIGAAVPGILLIAVGYSVNEATGAYAGELSSLPGMVDGLAMVLSLVPALFALVSFLVYKFCYKITPEMRTTMAEELEKRRAGNAEVTE